MGLPGFLIARKVINGNSAYVVGKIIGLMLFAYPIWLLASLKVLPFNNMLIILPLFFIVVVVSGVILFKQFRTLDARQRKEFLKTVLITECVSLLLYFAYLAVRGFGGALESTEKFMDLTLLSGAGKTDFFPFADPWQAALPVNYYYYGFYLYALLSKLGGIAYAFSYNFSLALIFSQTITISLAIVYSITRSRFFSILSAGLVALAGNLHYAVCFFKNIGGELATKCFYPTATRILDPSYTINEFPGYSFILGDLHPHVMSLPFFLTGLYLLWVIYKKEKLNVLLMVLFSAILATAAVINPFDFITLGLIFAIIIISKFFTQFYSSFVEIKGIKPFDTTSLGRRVSEHTATRSSLVVIKNALIAFRPWIFTAILTALSPFVLYFPFFAHYQSPVTGLGFAPEFVVKNNLVGTTQWPSSFWFLFGIWGLYALIFLIGLINIKKIKQIASGLFPFLLFLVAFVLIAFTELFFLQDLFHITNPPYFRSNTVFKFGYHAWILSGFASAVLLWAFWGQLKSVVSQSIYVSLLSVFIIIVFIFPIAGISQAYFPPVPENAKRFFTLDGGAFIKNKSIDDSQTIEWINRNIKKRTTILEAAGDSYGYFGRIGVFTGMKNPINWFSHQWTWRFRYPAGVESWREIIGQEVDTGFEDIKAIAIDAAKIYLIDDPLETEALLRRHDISYVYIGDLERETYPGLKEEKWNILGEIVFETGNSRLYKVGLPQEVRP